MEEQATPTKVPESVKNYDVMKLYSSSWELVKKNIKELAVITLIGVAINVLITALIVFVVINNISDGFDSAILTSMLSAAVAILASIYVGILQVVALKKASESKKIIVSEVVQESWKYVPVAIKYGIFIVAVFISGGFATGLLSSFVGPLGVLFGLALMVALIIAIFRYAFIQLLIVEDKPFGFMERFTVSQKLSNGIYGKLAMMWLIAVLLGIGAGIVGSIVSSPFNERVVDRSLNVQLKLNDDDNDVGYRGIISDATDEKATVNYFIREIITQTISWGIGLVILGAFLELYRLRKTDVGI